MSWVDAKYILLLSNRLERFKKVGNHYNFRCPLCGDSKTDPSKRRGYIYPKQGKHYFYCHNGCNGKLFRNFLKEVDPILYTQYSHEAYLENSPSSELEEKMKPPVFVKDTHFKELFKVSSLRSDHPCKEYVVNRKIPTTAHSRLFYCSNFKEWTNLSLPGKFEEPIEKDEARLVIPFLDKNGTMFAFQGRALDPKAKVRYITIVLDESQPLFFGLDKVDYNHKHYVLEGPLDSTFIPNAIAGAGGHITRELQTLPGDKSNRVIVSDNEPRNSDIVAVVGNAVAAGYPVCIWPPHWKYKDINEAVLGGVSPEDVKATIDKHTFTKLQAHLKFKAWKCV